MKARPNFMTVPAPLLAALLGLFLLMLWIGWVGYLGSDDTSYAEGAYGWLEHFPYVGGHGTIRYTITVPIALSFATFGENEISLALPTILYAIATVGLIVTWLSQKFSGIAALVAGGILVTTPLVVINSTFASVDIIEVFFLVAALLLFWGEAEYFRGGDTPRASRLIIAGVAIGLAFLTRETAVFMVGFLGCAFLFGYGMPRRYYWWLALGFGIVWGAEVIYLYAMTGDPLYRFNISVNHDSSIDRSIDLAGNTLVHPVVDPILVLFFNQEYGAFFWLFVGVMAWQAKAIPFKSRERKLVIYCLVAAAFWFVCVAAAVKLLPLNPRYFLLPFVLCCVAFGLSVHQIWQSQPRYHKAFLAVGSLFVALNFAIIFLENKSIRFPERQLVALAGSSVETIYTDPNTLYRARHLVRWGRVEDKISASAPQSEALYLFNKRDVNRVTTRLSKTDQSLYFPQSEWKVERKLTAPPRDITVLIDALGMKRYLPDRVYRLLYAPHEGVVLYRVS